MSIAAPSWLDEAFTLVADGRNVGAAQLLARAAELAPLVRALGRHRLILDARRPESVVLGLILAVELGLDLALARAAVVAGLDADAAHALAPDFVVWPEDGAAAPGLHLRLMTSGTTGAPKVARHRLEHLLARVGAPQPGGAAAVWLLTFEPASYAGLQVVLTAARGGATLVAPGVGMPELLAAVRDHAPTHVSGTPSFWRALLAAADTSAWPLRVATLGGEAAHQDVLDLLAARFPQARIRHIYASTEAGVGFTVADGRAGFPAAWLDDGIDDTGLRIGVDGQLLVRTGRGMLGYDSGAQGGADDDGWFATGDLVEVRDGRVLFVGRQDSMVNIGGVKVFPEAVEEQLSGVPGVVDLAVSARCNPILGHLLVAAMVVAPGCNAAEAEAALRRRAEEILPPPLRPVRYTAVDTLMQQTGKKGRQS